MTSRMNELFVSSKCLARYIVKLKYMYICLATEVSWTLEIVDKRVLIFVKSTPLHAHTKMV